MEGVFAGFHGDGKQKIQLAHREFARRHGQQTIVDLLRIFLKAPLFCLARDIFRSVVYIVIHIASLPTVWENDPVKSIRRNIGDAKPFSMPPARFHEMHPGCSRFARP